jgi:hypothetical protein
VNDQQAIDKIYDLLDEVEKMFLLMKARQSERYWPLQEQHMNVSVVSDKVWYYTTYKNADTTPTIDDNDVIDQGDLFE